MTAYRDDEASLQARAESLRGELGQLQADLAAARRAHAAVLRLWEERAQRARQSERPGDRAREDERKRRTFRFACAISFTVVVAVGLSVALSPPPPASSDGRPTLRWKGDR